MTGEQVIAVIRANYGDADNNYLATADLQQWVNQGVRDVYNLLPPGDPRDSIEQDTVTLTSGRGDLPDSWDRIVSVFTADGEAIQVPSSVAEVGVNLGAYFVPDVTTYAIDGNEIVVTPTTEPSVTVQYTVEPTDLTDFTNQIPLPRRYHTVVADIATSLAYASEEDAEQATWYLQRAVASVQTRLPAGE